MLSDQRLGTFKAQRRSGLGQHMLGPALQQGAFMSETPDQRRRSQSRSINSRGSYSPGAGFSSVGATLSPTGAGSPAPLAQLFSTFSAPKMPGPPPLTLGAGYAGAAQTPEFAGNFGPGAQMPQSELPQSNPLLQQLGMLLMSQRPNPPKFGQ